MSTVYAPQAAGALATLKRKGAAVTFTRTVPGTYDAATDVWSAPSTVTVSGYAIRDVGGNPQRYLALELIQSESPRLLFGPSTPGALPALGSAVTWNGVGYSVRDVEPIGPDGPAVVAYVIVSK